MSAVIFRLGRLMGAQGPGLFFTIPFVDRMVKVDLRVVTVDFSALEAITRDKITVQVHAVAHYRVIDPCAAISHAKEYQDSTQKIVRATLRSVLSQCSTDELFIRRDKASQQIQQLCDDQTEHLGVKVDLVELNVELPDTIWQSLTS